MIKSKLLLTSAVAMIGLFSSCCQSDPTQINNTDIFKPELVQKLVLMPSNSFLIASKDNVVDLYPTCYIDDQGSLTSLPPYAIKEKNFDFLDENGNHVSRYFSTTDPSLIGKTLKFKVVLKGGKRLESNWGEVTIVAPPKADELSEITIPVIFHLYQSDFDVKTRGLVLGYEFFTREIQRLNNAFSYKSVKNAAGIDTKIKFALAKYDPKGLPLVEPGLQRFVVSTDTMTIAQHLSKDLGDQLITTNNALWDPSKYLNIEVFADQSSVNRDIIQELPDPNDPKTFFAHEAPRFVDKDVDPATYPKNAGVEVYNDQPLTIGDQCLKVIFSNMTAITRGYGNNDRHAKRLPFYVGHFFGLLPAYSTVSEVSGADNDVDYCPLTQYFNNSGNIGFRSNRTQYKRNEYNFFTAQNIMDDQTSLPVSVTKDQNERLRFFLNHAIARQPWRSSFALTGK